MLLQDAPPPFVGNYPFRTSEKGGLAARGELTLQEKEERHFAANVAMHFAVPLIAGMDTVVAQGLHYPQR